MKDVKPDCIAIATQGRGLSRVFLGSVADKLIRSSGRPVLVLRPPTN
ncbi:MAG: universal stress protein [Gemmatimonadota bacterium]